MSKPYAHDTILWEDLRCKLRANVSSSGYCTGVDINTFVEIILLTCMILEDLPSGDSNGNYRRVLFTWAHYVSKLEPAYVASSFKVILISLLRISRKELKGKTYRHFKDDMLEKGLRDFSVLTSPVKVSLSLFLNEKQTWRISHLNQFFVLFSRLSLREKNFSKKNWSEYLQNEKVLREHSYSGDLLKALNTIVVEWFSNKNHPFSIAVTGRHASGSVHKPLRPEHYDAPRHKPTVLEKYGMMGSDIRLRYAFRDETIFTMYSLQRQCEVVFVPKSTDTWRTISMEPPALMFYQKAVQESLYDWIERHPTLKEHVQFTSQVKNHELTYSGSCQFTDEENYCTIDLSSASDLLSWHAVKHVFAGTPLLRYLLATRSTHYRYKNHSGELMKFAPMGSALCFPVMTLFLTACCELAMRMSRTHVLSNTYMVYGDDIIVPSEAALILKAVLSACAFKVNENKSFIGYDIPFRESCGREFYDGLEITPFRFPRTHVDPRFDGNTKVVDPEAFASRIQVINTLGERGYKTARAYLIRTMLKLPQHLRPLFSEDGLGCTIRTTNPTNFHLSYYPNMKLYGIEYRHGDVVSVPASLRNWNVLEWYRYYEYQRLTEGREELVEPCLVPHDGSRPVVKSRLTTLT